MATFNTSNLVTRGLSLVPIAIVLVLLYFVCVYLVLVSFSAYVIRNDWDTALAISSSEISGFDELVFLIERDDELNALISRIDEEIEAAEAVVAEKQSAMRAANLARWNLELKVTNTIAQTVGLIEEVLRIAPDGISLRISRFNSQEEGENDLSRLLSSAEAKLMVLRGGFERKEINLDIPDGTNSPLAAETEVYLQNISELKELQSSLYLDSEKADIESDRVEKRLKDLVDERSLSEGVLGSLREKLPVYSEHRARLRAIEGTNRYLSLGRLVKCLAHSVDPDRDHGGWCAWTPVAYSRTTFLEDERPPISKLLITIGQGVAAAIGVFLFAGAGLLAISQRGSGEDLDLSPYMVAFLAFVSGLMLDSAFGRIAMYGRSLFSPMPDNEPAAPARSNPDL